MILGSDMVDATKVPGLGEYSQRYHAWVGGIFPNNHINENILTKMDSYTHS